MDGSLLKGRGGSAFTAWTQLNQVSTGKYSLGMQSTSFDGEYFALYKALYWLLCYTDDNNLWDLEVVIGSDC